MMGNMIFDVAVAEAAVDDTCRSVMHKLVSLGCVAADTPYWLEPFQVAEADLRHLLAHGKVAVAGAQQPIPVLHSVAIERKGADVGKITFTLAVNLAS